MARGRPSAQWRTRLLETPVAVLAWLLAWPLGRLAPRDRRQIVVMGRAGGLFADNAKYFFISAVNPAAAGFDACFVTADGATFRALRACGARTLRYPGPLAIWRLLRAGAVVVDSAEWVRFGRYQLAAGALRIQLWHGVPLKAVEQAALGARLRRMGPLRRALYRAYLAFFCRYPLYDLLLSTSPQVSGRALQPAIAARALLHAGYPRNAFLCSSPEPPAQALVDVNTDRSVLRQVREWRDKGMRVVLYAPTFRTTGHNPVGGAVLDYGELDEFARRNSLGMVLKLHALLGGGERLQGLANVVEYQPHADVYPLLPNIDVLVTDYSSIYFDFLLIDRPVIFFAYDLEEYRQRERELLFDYRQITPGPTVTEQRALQEQILRCIAPAGDVYAAARHRVRDLVFDHADTESCAAVWRRLGEMTDRP